MKGKSSSTIAIHLGALADPLKYGWGLVLDTHSVQLLKCGHLIKIPLEGTAPFGPRKGYNVPRFHQLPGRTFSNGLFLFLVALASGFMPSQLKMVTRFPGYATCTSDGSAVSFAPSL